MIHLLLKFRLQALLLVALSIPGANTLAQTPLTDGEIIYSVKVDLPESAPVRASKTFKNGRLTFNFKNYLFRSEMQIGQMDYINIHNSKKNSAISLIDGGPGNKYLVRMNPREVEEEAKKFEGMTYERLQQTKKIAGYNCHKAIGKLSNGNAFTVFYTTELQPVYNSYSPRFEKLGGIPLQFEINTKNNTKLTMTATAVNTDIQPSALFEVPTSGYRELSYDQLQKLRKSK